MSIASRITSIEEHIGNAYNKLDDLGIDLTNVDKNIDNIASLLDTVYEEYPKVTGTGTELTLNGIKAGKLGLDVKGNSTQETTTGYQLFNINATNTRVYNCTITTNNNKLIQTNGGNYARSMWEIENLTIGETYDISLNYENPNSCSMHIRVMDSTNNTQITQSTTKTSTSGDLTVSFTATETTHCIRLYSNTTGTANTYTVTFLKILLKKSSTTGEWEPYTGGIASPNPSYEQPILSAGDNGSISEKIVNKNLLINNKTTATYVGITFTVNDDKSITMSGTATSQSNLYLFGSYTEYVDLGLPPGNYVFSGITGGSTSTYINYLVKKDKNENISTYAQTTEPKTFTINEGDTFRVFLRVIGGYSFGDNPVTAYPQLELGSTATTYTVHQEQTYTIPVQQPMRSIGTVRDEFIQVNGNWFERHNIVRYIFTGNENWGGAPSVVTGTARFYIEKSDVINDNNVQIKRIYSNRFKALTWDEIYQSDTTTINAISNYNSNTDSHRIVIRIDSTIASTKTELNTYLLNNPTYADYVLQTPVDLPCTSEQIAILENLPKSYNEQTNIYSLDVTPAYVETQALKGE